MNRIDDAMLELEEPVDYYGGVARNPELPVPSNILLFLRATRRKLQQEALQNRSHHRFVLVFNLETAGNVHVDDLVLPLRPGQALIVLPYQFHHFSQLASDEIRWLFCTFELGHAYFLEPLRNRVLDVRDESFRALRSFLEEWHRCADPEWQGEFQEARLQTALVRLLLSLQQDLHASAPDLPPEPRDSLVRTVNRLMSEWRGRPVVVADVAEALGLSSSRLRARFREAAGIPLGRYIKNYQLNRAMALLRTTDLPVAQVAEEAGFGSPQAYSRIFKNKTGSTCREYRRRG